MQTGESITEKLFQSTMTKKLTLSQIAAQKSGKERHCAKCEFKVGKICLYVQICDAAFRRGFIKGYEYHRNKTNQKTIQQ